MMTAFQDIEQELHIHLSDDSLKFCNEVNGGIVNRAAIFNSQRTNEKYFVKYNAGEKSKVMFETEQNSLQLLSKTKCVTVPASFKVFSCENVTGAVHVLEYLPTLSPLTDYWGQFGQQMGKLHSYNAELIRKSNARAQSVHQNDDTSSLQPVEKFGNDYEHFIGTFTPGQVWRPSWQELFMGDILDPLIIHIVEKYRDLKLQEKWSWLQLHLHRIFDELTIVPAINHGDLCVANFGQTETGPVLFDPSVLYGHNQFDLILSHEEEQFDEKFFQEYHCYVPKGKFWDECMLIYEFFYCVVMLYHGVMEEKYRTTVHIKADRVREMLQCQFGVK